MNLTLRPIRWRYLLIWGMAVLAALSGVDAWAQSLTSQLQQNAPYRELYRKGEYAEALQLLQKEIDSRPELANAKAFRYIFWLSNRADIFSQMGRIDEAIQDLKTAVDVYPEPVFILRLALLDRERGRMDDFKAMLDLALQQSQSRWSFHPFEENIAALARIAELRGENPKQLLSSLYKSLMDNAPQFSPGFSGAGDLAYRRGAYDLAEGYYKKAIEIDATNLDAYAGLAETYWKANDPRLEEIVKHILQVNPHHFRAKAIQAELLLDKGDGKAALELLLEPLSINPNQLRLRSLQAAAYFLLDKPDELRRVRQDVLAFNPVCSEIDRVPGRIASRHYRFREGIAFQESALKTDPGDVEARTQYGLDLLRLGEDEKGRKELETAFAADPYNVQVYNLLNLLDSLKSFDTIQSASFVVQCPKPETPIWRDEAVSLLEEAISVLGQKYEVTLNPPIHAQIFNDHDDFMVRSVGLPGMVGFMGICFGQLITMDSPSARPRLSMNWRSVLWHEFTHVVTLQKTDNRMPRWLSEGISVYEETQKSPAWGQRLKPLYKELIAADGAPGVSDLETYFVQPKTPNHLMLGYYLAGEFVRFFTEKYGVKPLAQSLEGMGKGQEAISALAASCSQSISEIDANFKQFLDTRLAPLQNLPAAQGESNFLQKILGGVTESKPDDSRWLERESPFTGALREAAKAFQEQRWSDTERLYEDAFRLFPDYSGENEPLRQLTLVYERLGNKEKQIETLWRRAEWDSLDFDACRQLVAIYREKGDWERVAKAALLALSVDPFHIETRQTLENAYVQSAQNDLALREIQKLIELDPNRKIDYRLERIAILLRLNDKERAKRETLLLLEEVPHLWKAQEMLLTIAEGQ